MDKYLQKSIAVSFYVLVFFTPLILFTKTSEIFEFNKIVFVYALTVIITALWLTRTVLSRQVIFRRSLLTIPILLFILVQAIATFYSIDVRTSIFGFFGRYHGGLLSSISYALLYFAFVSNLTALQARKMLKLVIVTATLVAVYAVLQRFGVDENVWAQDVRSRVFSTLGQPNWLAAYLVAVIPIVWAQSVNEELRTKNFKPQRRVKSKYVYLLISLIMFVALVFTRSRSGMLGFIVANIIFWPITWKCTHKRTVLSNCKKSIRLIVIVNAGIFVAGIIIGATWLMAPRFNAPDIATQYPTITSTVEIRKLLWQGARDIWREHPVLGTGPETFGYTYYWHRPVRHNQTIEWSHLYNKAHNEYLHFAANTGVVGLVSYLLLILAILLLMARQLSIFLHAQAGNSPADAKLACCVSKAKAGKQSSISRDQNILYTQTLTLALLSGFVSILVTNFFGFSVVVVALLFFLYPAILIVICDKQEEMRYESKLSTVNVLMVLPILLATSYMLLAIGRYWYSDFLYAQGKSLNDDGQYEEAVERLHQTNSVFRHPVYVVELSDALANLTVREYESHNIDKAYITYENSRTIGANALLESPYDITLANKYANTLIKLSAIESENLELARDLLENSVKLAPTDPKTLYNLGLAYYRTGDTNRALEILKKTVKLKPDYKEPRFATALLLQRAGDTERAMAELEYILENIDPEDEQTIKKLQELQ